MNNRDRRSLHYSAEALRNRLEEFLEHPTERGASWVVTGLHDHLQLDHQCRGKWAELMQAISIVHGKHRGMPV